MRVKDTFNPIPILTVIIGVMAFQSCDLATRQEPFENPYTKEVQETFEEVSRAVFGNIEEHLRTQGTTGVTRRDILRWADEGYKRWASKTGIGLEVFEAGMYSVHNFTLNYRKDDLQYSENRLDSLLKERDLTTDQKKYIQQLPKILNQSSNIATLNKNLTIFNNEVFTDLERKRSRPVLKMSALLQVATRFLLTKGKLLYSLIQLIEENNRTQAHFYRPSLIVKSQNLFQFIQSQDGATDPPDARDYFNGYEVAHAIFNGALAGGGSGAAAGAALGSTIPGVGTMTVGALGGIIGAVGVGSGSGFFEFYSQLSVYSQAVNNWCDDPINYSHKDYDSICEADDDSDF